MTEINRLKIKDMKDQTKIEISEHVFRLMSSIVPGDEYAIVCHPST